MRIVELVIEDEQGFVDGIALVQRPAHESNWLTFAEEQLTEYRYINEELGSEKAAELAELLVQIGEPEEDLLAEGYEIYRVEEINPKHQFASGKVSKSVPTEYGPVKIISDPNNTTADPLQGAVGVELVRYKYVGPRDNKNRDFCRIMLEENRVFRKEDIDQMTIETANPQFGNYDIFTWRGSYNCRHKFVKVIYRPKAGEGILNDASVRRGRIGQEEIPQESTVTNATAGAQNVNYIREQIQRRINKGLPVPGLRAGVDVNSLNAQQILDIGLQLGIGLVFAEIGERGAIKESKKAPKSTTPNPKPTGVGSARGDASGKGGADVSEAVEKNLREKVKEFNDRYADKLKWGKLTIGQLKSVFQRGKGAYNVSHSPKVKSADQWAYARVNAFIYLWRTGRPENAKYKGDNDLLPANHPKYTTNSKMGFETTRQYCSTTPCEQMGQAQKASCKKQGFRNCYKGEFGILDVIDGIPLFDNLPDALKMGELIGCEGYHTHDYNGVTGYMPCYTHPGEMSISISGVDGSGSSGCGCMTEDIEDEYFVDYPWNKCMKDQIERYGSKEIAQKVCGSIRALYGSKLEFETYDDYPQYITENAKKALKYLEESGNPNNCLTPVGRRRVSDLASGKPISGDIIKRMKAYADRHKKDLEVSKSFEDGCGLTAWYSWGLDETGRVEEYLERKLKQIEEEFEIVVSGLAPYVDQTGKKKKPTIVQRQFNYDEEKQEITGAAIIPNKFIIRRDEMGQLYYVYFSEETTKKLAEGFFKQKQVDLRSALNIEHTEQKAEDTYIVESWIVNDPEKDKSKSLGLDYPKGTWVITAKIENPQLWKDIKTGKYNGFSIEGYFLEKIIFTNINKK